MRKIVVDMMGGDLGSQITAMATKNFHQKLPMLKLFVLVKKRN